MRVRFVTRSVVCIYQSIFWQKIQEIQTINSWLLSLTHNGSWLTDSLQIPPTPPLQEVYSQLFLNGHRYKTDISLRRAPGVGPCSFSVILLYPVTLLSRDGQPSQTDNRHFWNCQQTLGKSYMRWKIPQNRNVGALHDSKLQNFDYFVVLLQLVEYILLDHEAVNVSFMNEPLIAQWENDSTFLLQYSSLNCFVQVKQLSFHCEYWCHVTLTLYEMDTSLRRAVRASPEGVCLSESWLYIEN